MKPHALKNLARRVDEAGAVADRRRTLETAVTLLEHDIERLEEQKTSLREAFQRKLEAWWSRPVRTGQVPFSIREDHRDGVLYQVAGVASIIFEALVGAWICVDVLDLPWWIGPIVAIVTAVIFHGGFVFLCRHLDRPKETLGKLKRWLLKPAVIVLLASFAALLLSRTVSGDLAVWLLGLLSASLWTCAVGCLVFGGALFAAAHVMHWSCHDSRHYAALDAEQLRSRLRRDEFRTVLKDEAA